MTYAIFLYSSICSIKLSSEYAFKMIRVTFQHLHCSICRSYVGTLTINAVWNTTGTTVQPTFPLVTPRSMSFDSSGNMYVADVNLCAVFKYPACGTVYPTVFAGVNNNCSSGTTNLNQPEGAFLDSLGNLYVVSLTKLKRDSE